MQVFNHFREDLDEHYDRRERIVKASRDITISSKRAIFLLHRIAAEDDDELTKRSSLQAEAPNEPRPTAYQRAAIQGFEHLRTVQVMFCALREELGGERFWRYHYQISPGLQEYIEAFGLAHYLAHGTLVPFTAIQESLSDEQGVFVPLAPSDYLLGLADLSGELMRLAIGGLTRRGGPTRANSICSFVRDCKMGEYFPHFDTLAPSVRDLDKKQAITAQSLRKIEDAAYTVAIRTSEYRLAPEEMEFIVRRAVAEVAGTTDTLGKHEREDDGFGGRSDHKRGGRGRRGFYRAAAGTSMAEIREMTIGMASERNSILDDSEVGGKIKRTRAIATRPVDLRDRSGMKVM
ncbi:Translin [Fistulina hepatica ATCC 64428]|nr:Translin [Fistulina hepatica ATCC 64428]